MKHQKASTYLQHAIISDLTGTLIRQRPDGFAEPRRQIIRELIEGGCFFCIVTNDTFEAAQEFFVTPLGSLTLPYFIISGGGYVGHQVLAQKSSCLFKGRGMNFDTRMKIGQRIEQILTKALATAVLLPAPKDDEAERTSIASLNENFGPLSFFESTPSKVALFFLDGPVATNTQQSLFDAIQSDSVIQALLAKDQLHLTRGANYLDITSSIKSDGVRLLYSSSLSSSYNLTDRNITVMGDSLNDKDLLLYNFKTSMSIRRVFLGEDQALAAQITNTYPGESLFLEATYVDGAGEILEQVALGSAL